MNNWLQATRERGRVCPPRGRCAVASLLLLGGWLVGSLPARGATQLVINPISDTNLNVTLNPTLTIRVSVTNTVAANSLSWSLGSGAPSGASIANDASQPNAAVFTWTPTGAEVPSTNSITVKVFDIGNLQNNDAKSFTVAVLTNTVPVAHPPYLALPFTETNITFGMTLTFTAFATNTDGSANALTFSLDPNAVAAGATISNSTPTNGVFRWTPAVGGFYDMIVVVTEQNTSQSATQAFIVNVLLTNNCAQYADFVAAVAGGGLVMLTNCPTIVLSNTVTISTSVTLDAGTNNVTIAGNNLLRLFTVLPGVTNFTLRGLTLSGGKDADGAGLYISQGAVVLLTNCTLAGNRAVGADGLAGTPGSSGGVDGGNGGNGTAGGSAFGGAIYNLGSLTVLSCQFLTNSTAGGNGGAGGDGGDGSGTLSHGGNGGHGGNGAPGHGGAIYSAGGLSLSNCTFSGNSVSGGSGGAGGTNGTGRFAGSPGTGGVGTEGSGAAVYSANNAVILNCTFSGNVAQGGNGTAGGTDSNGDGVAGTPGADSLGGGICNVNTVFLTNCTFSNNQVTGGNGGDGGSGTGTLSHGGNGGNGGNGTGGGLYNTGTVAVVNCTFSGCGAAGGTNGVAGSAPFPGSDGSPGRGRGGDVAQSSGTFILRNSILAATSAGTNAYDTSASRITDGGYNISSDASLNLSGTSRKNTDPKVGSLADNGGPTQTIALQSGSPAIDAIPPGFSPATDQRGVPRPQGAGYDIGAFEVVTQPAIATQPQSQTIPNGSPVTFTVSAFGDGLYYQWRFNSTNLASATATSFSLASVAPANAGRYDVVLTNSYGSITSAPATLTVIYPPVIVSAPASLSVLRGSNATFAVQAAGLVPLSYQWQFNGTNLSAGTASAYIATNAQPADAGTYTVAITNAHGSVTSAPAILTVNVPPYITTPPVSQTVAPGSNVTFRVTAGGTVPLSYQWRFNGSNISGATVSAYGINGVQATNAGTYDVIVANNFGSTNSSPATLTVARFFTITGRVVQRTNGLPGVKVSAGTNISFTGAGGYYTNLNVPEGANVLVVPSLAGYAFAPSAQSLVVLSNTSLPDFMAFPPLALARGSNGAFQLTFTPAFTCQVLTSTNLHNWQPVFTTTNISTDTLLLQFTDTNSASFPRSFYRLGETFAGPPVLTNWTATNHSVSLGCVAAPVLACQIQASTNLTSWVTVFNSNLPAAASFQFRYGDATNLPVRFYRLSQTPGF